MRTDITQLINYLRLLGTPEAFGNLILQGDSCCRRLTPDKRRALLGAALTDGNELAKLASARWGRDPKPMANTLGLTVEIVAGSSDYGTNIVFADYWNKLKTIRLYRPAIAHMNLALADPAWANWLGIADVSPVFIAHEIYHHLDVNRGKNQLVRRHPVSQIKVGRWQWDRHVRVLAEVAAGSFVRQLLNLEVHAKCLEFAALYKANPQNALQIAAGLASGD